MKRKLVIGLICTLIVVIGIFGTAFYRLNFKLLYKAHKQVDVSIGKEFDNKDIIAITKEVVGNKKVVVQKLEVFEDMASISVEDISDEEIESLNAKLNEKYEIENTTDDIKVTSIPKATFTDYIKPYIKPLIISLTLLVLYVLISVWIDRRINKNGH